MYIHHYIRGVGRLLSFFELPPEPPSSPELWHKDARVRFFSLMVDFLVNIRQEEVFFLENADKYGIDLHLDSTLEGLRRFETLFGKISGPDQNSWKPVPWLEAAILFWGTEKCYLDAWSGAASNIQPVDHGGRLDADGGALRREFIPNWSSSAFRESVDKLGKVIDDAVDEILVADPAIKESLVQRSQEVWDELLSAEREFWPSTPATV